MSKPSICLFPAHSHDSTVLHPRYKTTYFENENWEKEWIETAKDILTEQWETHYRDAEAVPAADEANDVRTQSTSLTLS